MAFLGWCKSALLIENGADMLRPRMGPPLETYSQQIGLVPNLLVSHCNSGWTDQQLRKAEPR